MQETNPDRVYVRRVITAAVHLAVLTGWVTLCARFLLPFFFPVLWGAIIATAVWPLFARRFRTRPKLGAVIFLVVALALVLLPSWLAIDSIADSVVDFGRKLNHDNLKVPPPDPRVANWPIVGPRAYSAWQHVFETPSALAERLMPQVRPMGRWLMESVGHMLAAFGQTLFAVLIAAVFLANAEVCTRVVTLLVEKLLPERGKEFTNLAGATVRSVSQGVIGISIVQSLLSAVGLVLADVPGAVVWAALILALAIMQLPPLLVLGPACVYVFTTHSTPAAVAFLVWSLIVSASDGLLKPFVLGRGVGVPTLVILMGAIGGMISDGIIGLFVGSVMLAVGYKIAAIGLRSETAVSSSASLERLA